MVDDSHRELSSRRHERGEESPGPAASELSATAVASGIRDGEFSAEDVTRSCLDRIGARESDVGAWVNLDPDHALDQARAADERQRAGTRLGPLHGVPVGVKDIFDTTDFPTEWGSPICFGRQPIEDSAVVNRLRSAGAVILGKTVTSEFAAWRPGPTRNPHDLTRTPGGSSSGSAAAVADKMVPLAVGSQTEGSTIRPASYCGVVGFKPSFGAISRRGVMRLSPSLDHVGLFSRSVADIWLLAGALFRAGRELVAEARGAPIRLGFVPSPFWDHATRELRDSFERYAEAARLPRVDLPPGFEDARTVRDRISSAEIAVEFGELHGRAADRLDDLFRRTIERGQAITHDELEESTGSPGEAGHFARRRVRRLRCAGHTRRNRRRRFTGHNRRPGVQQHLDVVREPGHQPSAVDRAIRIADRGPARGASWPRWRFVGYRGSDHWWTTAQLKLKPTSDTRVGNAALPSRGDTSHSEHREFVNGMRRPAPLSDHFASEELTSRLPMDIVGRSRSARDHLRCSVTRA